MLLVLLAATAAGFLALSPAAALEGGQSAYLKGFRDFLTGQIPLEPGVQMRQDTYYYSGSGTVGSAGTRRLDANISGLAELVGPIFVSPWQFLGGTYAASARLAATDLTLQRTQVGPAGTTVRTGSLVGPNDVQLTPVLLGWHAGNFHWNVGTSVWLPVGSYEAPRVANTGRNYLSTAVHGAVTYFDPASGWDLSVAAAFLVNSENTATQYRSGDVLHMDFAVGRNITPDFRIGAVGYVMQQLTADSGTGAVFGDNISRVAALGPAASYSWKVGETPVVLLAKFYREFLAQNTTQGNAATLSLRFNF